MDDPRTILRVLWCEVATLAVVLTGDIPLWLSAAMLVLVPVLGLSGEAPWVAGARRLTTFLTPAYFVFFPLDWLVLSGRLIFATVHLMFYLKLHTILNQKTPRDRSRLHLLCLLEMLGAASMTVDARFFFPLTVFVLLGALVLVLEQAGRASVTQAMTRAGARTALVLGVPVLGLAGLAFVLLPRAQYAGFRLGGITGVTVTGFSEEVRLGDFEEIKRSSDVVMRILADRTSLSPPRWRGPAYDRYQNGRWRQSLSSVSSLPRGPNGTFLLDRPSDAPKTTSEVYLEPLDTDVLFLPPASTDISAPDRFVFIDAYLTLRTGRSARAGRRYSVVWRPQAPDESSSVGGVERLSQGMAGLYTQTDRLSDRVRALAADIVSDATGLDAAAKLEEHLRSEYRYTLAQPERRNPDPLEDFLFDARAGHCEYFATAMVMMLRSVDVPSRLVTGFTRGQRNALGDYELVRKTNAHAWVEAYDAQRGWVTFDPTPSSADTTTVRELGLFTQSIDSLKMLWDMYVVAFDVERQRGVLGRASASAETTARSSLPRTRVSIRCADTSVTVYVRVGRRRSVILAFILLARVTRWGV